MLIFFRTVVCVMAGISLVLFLSSWQTGRAVKRGIAEGKSVAENLEAHRNRAKAILWITGFTIIFIEGFGRFFLHILTHPPIFWIHLIFFAVPFAALLLLVAFSATGLKKKKIHRIAAPWCIRFGVGTNVLGAILAFMAP